MPNLPLMRNAQFPQEEPQLGPHKVILVGDSGVGKSSFMLRLCDDAFNEKMNPSFGTYVGYLLDLNTILHVL